MFDFAFGGNEMEQLGLEKYEIIQNNNNNNVLIRQTPQMKMKIMKTMRTRMRIKMITMEVEMMKKTMRAP